MRKIERSLAPFLPGPRSKETALFQAYTPSSKKGKARRARELERLAPFEPVEVQRLRRSGVELPFAVLRTGSYQLGRAERGGRAPFQPARITAPPRFHSIRGAHVLVLSTEAGQRWLVDLDQMSQFARDPEATLQSVVEYAESLGLEEAIVGVRAGSYIHQVYRTPRDLAEHVQRMLLKYKAIPGHEPHRWFRGFVIMDGASRGGRA